MKRRLPCSKIVQICALGTSLLLLYLGLGEAALLPLVALVDRRNLLRGNWRLGALSIAVFVVIVYVDYSMGLSACPSSVDPIRAFVVAPLGEETAFRGVLQGYLRRYTRIGALAVSSVAFGLMHGDPALATLYGLSLGLAFESFGLAGSIIIHVANNMFWAAQCAPYA